MPPGPQKIDGRSLVPTLRDTNRRIRDHAYHAYPRDRGRLGRAIRTERYRLVEWKRWDDPVEAAEFELYDYASDPAETRNLADDLPEALQNLKEILERHPPATTPVRRPPR